MNLALDRYADNPIIDELVFWPPKSYRIKSVRACCVMFRKPFIEVELEGDEIFQRHFGRESFARYWAEACVILETITRIELISDFEFEPVSNAEHLAQKILACRDECIAESNLMFEQGMYAQYLIQYGEDCKNLPLETIQKIIQAKQQLATGK
ncbi:MAG: hypothetical protein OES20_07175 [Gammaproteobacteria bacterium]|nr:hypothetical protein [Gammaproteobacteria bacterium]MDH3859092.1 hypothetical protein [Gammaproteobacteria bacterium]